MFKVTSIAALAVGLNIVSASAAPLCQLNDTFKVGAGIYDVTGPAAEEGMMGYALIKQKTAGILQRLWARAFVIESPCSQKRVVFVNTDLGMIFQVVKQQVIVKLKAKYGDQYDDSNVLLTATHTHSGPGGFSTYTLYDLSTLGFDRKHLDTIVDGIVMAIERAQNNMIDAKIKVATGTLSGVNYNRSPASYLLNPQSERDRYAGDTDTQMTLIRFDTLTGKPIGSINWFPVHGTSLNNKNHLISGDNKGYAEYLFEKDFKSDNGPTAFVSAFAQANAGDASPNEFGSEGGEGASGILAVEKAGRPQYEAAKKLYTEAKELVKGDVDYRHSYYEMSKMNISPEYTNGQPQTLCPAAIGVSMLAGTQDGEGVGVQGVTCDTISALFHSFTCSKSTTTCQGVKPIAIQTELMKPYPWTPNILPMQIVRIGNLIIVAAPFEITTMTGRRIKETVEKQFPASQGYHVVISALSNAYSQYVATNEEYQLQRYEGASTQFGPWESSALRQEFDRIAKALASGEPVNPGPAPLDLLDKQHNLQSGVLFDDVPPTKKFGDIHKDVSKSYKRGETAEAVFWGAHPRNDYHTQDSYLAVQHLVSGQWETIAKDNDWETEFHWQRFGASYSLVTVTWRIPKNVEAGQYRLAYYGDWKSGWTGKISSFVGRSSPFTL